MTSGIPESTVATNEFVVPKSMPTIRLMTAHHAMKPCAGQTAIGNQEPPVNPDTAYGAESAAPEPIDDQCVIHAMLRHR